MPPSRLSILVSSLPPYVFYPVDPTACVQAWRHVVIRDIRRLLRLGSKENNADHVRTSVLDYDGFTCSRASRLSIEWPGSRSVIRNHQVYVLMQACRLTPAIWRRSS